MALGHDNRVPLPHSSNAESLDRLLPPVGTGRSPRKRTTSQCKSEPPLLRTSKRTIYTAGRPPWYNEHGTQSKEAFAIGEHGCGGKGEPKPPSGGTPKSEAAVWEWQAALGLICELGWATVLKVSTPPTGLGGGSASGKTTVARMIIEALDVPWLLDMKIFVDTDSDIRLVRRLRRDISERGRDIEGVIKQYNKFVKPAFDQYIQPTMRVADIVVPRGSGNTVAIDLIVQHVHSQLEERELSVRAALASAHQCHPLPRTLSVLKSTPQVRGMHTIIRDRETSRDEFIFYSKRLMRLLIEHALSFLPFQDCVVQTPQGQDYAGKCYAGKQITGVSILRAGETMEPALRAVCKDVRIGTILIQTNQLTGEPEDHDVPEDKIFLLSLLMAEMGVHSVAYAFPRVRIITTAVDKRVNDLFRIIPGIGNFGDRYFGTDAVPDGSDDEEGGSTG
ncbi:hypothetical protein Celaphus_00007727 [Cervus elaphus hippelaphus]|uniref:Uncharacterized protein n=1 Tax=Cervus elaphus hippelaphus TaxID=46360 RepID=A0A212CB50_CEREH|nr:hypothetical protein Celaphus_00007727 [Cervus elaphus hippelaphus]